MRKILLMLIFIMLLPSPPPAFSVVRGSAGGGTVSLNTSHALSTDMQLCYVFKDGSGNTVTDLTANNNTGTLHNVTWDGSVAHGAIDLSQSSSYVSTASQVLNNTINQYSIMIFAHTPATLDTNGALFDNENGSSWQCVVNTNNNVSFETRIDGDSTKDGMASNSAITAGADLKIVVTHDGTTTDEKKIYLNGTLDRTTHPTAHGEGHIGNGDKTWVGYDSDGYNFTGEVYAIYVWTGRILTQSEINDLQTDAYVMINGVSE